MSQLKVITLLMLSMVSTWHLATSLSSLDWQLLAVNFDRNNSSSVDTLWTAFKQQHERNYDDAEEILRREIFADNVETVAQHNHLHRKGLHSFKTTINKFADMELTEFTKKFNGYRQSVAGTGARRPNTTFHSSLSKQKSVELPGSIDWRLLGMVTHVKDQGDCGACWAFSATGALEGQHYRKTGDLVLLSEQNLIDCSTDFGNHGCDGGVMDVAFEYVMMNKGIDTEWSYPYEAKSGKCRYTIASVGATDTGLVNLFTGDEWKLMDAVATVGPVSAAIDASQSSFRFYDKGVYDEPTCSSTKLNHGVLVVGYGQEDGVDYWLIKNSWGKWWGDEGYMKIARNKSNMCGIASAVSYPLVYA